MSNYRTIPDAPEVTVNDFADGMRAIAAFFEGMAEGYRELAEEPGKEPTSRIVSECASDILSAFAFALADAADAGHPGPVQSLADATNEWLNAAAVFDIATEATEGGAEPHPHEVLRLADDGCPNHEE